MQPSVEKMTLKDIFSRMAEINIELATESYSQSDPGAMMNRHRLRKERDALNGQLAKLTAKKQD